MTINHPPSQQHKRIKLHNKKILKCSTSSVVSMYTNACVDPRIYTCSSFYLWKRAVMGVVELLLFTFVLPFPSCMTHADPRFGISVCGGTSAGCYWIYWPFSCHDSCIGRPKSSPCCPANSFYGPVSKSNGESQTHPSSEPPITNPPNSTLYRTTVYIPTAFPVDAVQLLILNSGQSQNSWQQTSIAYCTTLSNRKAPPIMDKWVRLLWAELRNIFVVHKVTLFSLSQLCGALSAHCRPFGSGSDDPEK